MAKTVDARDLLALVAAFFEEEDLGQNEDDSVANTRSLLATLRALDEAPTAALASER